MFLWQHGLKLRIILPTLLREKERKNKRMNENETTKRALRVRGDRGTTREKKRGTTTRNGESIPSEGR